MVRLTQELMSFQQLKKKVTMMTDKGQAYTFGRNEKGQLGNGGFKSTGAPCLVTMKNSSAKKAAQSDDAAGAVKFVHAATGRSHSLLVSAKGRVYSAGENKAQQLGHALNNQKDQPYFALVSELPSDLHFVKVACGVDFSLALTKDGQVWSWGSPQYVFFSF
jgi:alpha-tubulin suppressor-like RCC1 family protein